jgi:methylated-DNA-[protein]-cysteine S-methyltransferase
MANPTKYTIFKTKWGYFGLVANKKGLLRTCLPHHNSRFVKRLLLKDLANPHRDNNLLKDLQNKIVTYFAGQKMDFPKNIPLSLNWLAPFTKQVLTACRQIPYGKTTTYLQLARMIGNPGASRAVGNALAKNPVPLVVPCHRVIRSDGSIGAFSAPGGKILKRKLIDLERGERQTAAVAWNVRR